MIPDYVIVTPPAKRYDGRGRQVRGARRSDSTRGRVLTLLDRLGVRKRTAEVRMLISHEGLQMLRARAERAGVTASALAAYIVEASLRGRA